MMNENAIANIIVDLDFLEEQFHGAGRANLASLFTELRAVRYRFSHRLALVSPPSSFLLFVGAPHIDNINSDVRFGDGVPDPITTPNDVRNRQAEKARYTA
jgi:hypothetical protein